MEHNAEHPFLNYLGVSLWISSTELTPEDITGLVGLRPTYTRHRGAAIAGRNLRRRPEFDVHEWQFRRQLDAMSGGELGEHTEQFIDEFLTHIGTRALQIRKLSEHHSVALALVYHVDNLPYIGLTRGQVQSLAELGIRVDYDLMIKENSFGAVDESTRVQAG